MCTEVMETHKEIIESDNEGSQTSCLDVVQYLLDSSPTSSDHDGPWENPFVETQDSDEQSDIVSVCTIIKLQLSYQQEDNEQKPIYLTNLSVTEEDPWGRIV